MYIYYFIILLFYLFIQPNNPRPTYPPTYLPTYVSTYLPTPLTPTPPSYNFSFFSFFFLFFGGKKNFLAGFSTQINPSNNRRLSIYLVIFGGYNRGFSNALP